MYVYIYIYIYIYIYNKVLNSKAYNKRMTDTDIISHSSSERRSIFNASCWSKLSNVTGCFTACKGVHSFQMSWIICSRLEFDLAFFFFFWGGGGGGTCGAALNSHVISVIVSSKTHQFLGVIAFSIDRDLKL